jgi:hypothetical protein
MITSDYTLRQHGYDIQKGMTLEGKLECAGGNVNRRWQSGVLWVQRMQGKVEGGAALVSWTQSARWSDELNA